MNETGSNLVTDGAAPKRLTDAEVVASDVVITVGCGDACPLYPGKRYLDCDLDDRAAKSIEDVRRIRDDLDERVKALVTELGLVAAR